MKKQYNIRLDENEKKVAESDASRFGMDFTGYIRFLIALKHNELQHLKNGNHREAEEILQKSVWNPRVVNPQFVIHSWIGTKLGLGLISNQQAEKERKAWKSYQKKKGKE